jgi:aminomethyltransferase
VVKPAAGDFIGKAALEQQRGEGVSRRLAGFVMQGRGIARHGYGLHTSAEGPRVGLVTSGSYCPTVDKAVGLGYLPVELAEAGATAVRGLPGPDDRGPGGKRPVLQGPGRVRFPAPARTTRRAR